MRERLVRMARVITIFLCSWICCKSVEAGNFSWVASANTSTLTVNELAGGVANGITVTCTQNYPIAKYGFYIVGTDYLSPKDGTYIYSVTVTVSKKGSQGSDVPPVDSFSFSGYSSGAPAIAQRRQLLVQAAQVAASELCRRLTVKR
jgi:hypothetical protein